MPTVKWLGTAEAVAQVDSITVGGTVEAGDVFTCTINGKALSISAADTVAANVAIQVRDAWNASLIPEFAEITAAASGAVVSLTADTKGKPFTVTATTTEAGGGAADAQTFTRAAVTANAGPNDWSTATNWSGGAVPVNSDDVVLENSAVSILYGLDQSGVTLTSLTIMPTYTGKIGLPVWAGLYSEYRTRFLTIKATTQTLDCSGSQQVKIDNSTAQTTGTVRGTGQTATLGVPALELVGTHASNVWNVFKGDVGFATNAGQSAVIATLNVGFLTNPGGDSKVVCGSGVTLTTINQNGGDLTINSAATTITKTDGILRCFAGAITTLNERGGKTYYNSTGTITTLTVAAGGTFTTEQDSRARTITNTTCSAKSALLDPNKSITFTNAVSISGCGLYPIDPDGVTLDLGQNFSIQRS